MNSFKGYGFRPSEEELIGYLRNRTFLGSDDLVPDITDLGVHICTWDPWDLPGLTKITPSDPVWYFIYPITYKHTNQNRKMISMATDKGPNSKRKRMIDRATKKGRWKVSGESLKVRASDSKKIIGVKTRLYFYKGLDNEEGNKKSKAKRQNSYYPCKTPWVLYEYELTDVDSSNNKYFLGKLMKKQSEAINKSISKGETSQLPSNSLGNEHIQIPEVQVGFDKEPLVEMEEYNYNNWVQNQSSISEQATEFVNPCPLYNYGIYPELETSGSSENEVTANLQTSNLENFAADCATPQEDLMDLFRELEVPNLCFGDENQNDLSFKNSVSIGNDEAERIDQHNIVAESEGFSLPNNFNNYPVAEIAQMNLEVDLMDLITEPEVPDSWVWEETQHDLSFQNLVPIDNGEA